MVIKRVNNLPKKRNPLITVLPASLSGATWNCPPCFAQKKMKAWVSSGSKITQREGHDRKWVGMASAPGQPSFKSWQVYIQDVRFLVEIAGEACACLCCLCVFVCVDVLGCLCVVFCELVCVSLCVCVYFCVSVFVCFRVYISVCVSVYLCKRGTEVREGR